jgi:hypothetical protein
MTENTALLKRQGTALLNFMSMKRQNDRPIGDLTLGDFVESKISEAEMIAFLAELESDNAGN